MPFVLDASIAACWAFDDEDHPVVSGYRSRVMLKGQYSLVA